jgi:hypothetical protein
VTISHVKITRQVDKAGKYVTLQSLLCIICQCKVRVEVCVYPNPGWRLESEGALAPAFGNATIIHDLIAPCNRFSAKSAPKTATE